MFSIIVSIISCVLIANSFCADPTNYEYYTSGGIKSGLKADSVHFTLNGKQITLLSGSLHYFRLPHQYWKETLLKFRAAGLNSVQTYVAWNLHEETPGHFDFQTGFLNLAEFLKAAKEADLFVVFRIGPFICAEWEFGGFPAWLLRDPHMNLRSNYKPYLSAVGRYLEKTLAVINEYQFTKGGPIIALQYENEYGGIWHPKDKEYFDFMKNTIVKSGFHELLFNCDPASHAIGAAKLSEGILETINFNSDSLKHLHDLSQSQPNKPLYVSEFWPGWFDFWGDKTHHTMTIQHFEKEVTDIVINANASINFYMFFGGTNFGFMAGDNKVTSYDYNAPLSESGNYTDKYWKTKEIFAKLTKERGLPKTHIPDPPKVSVPEAYGVVKMRDYLNFEDLLAYIKPIESNEPKHMEYLDIGSNFGQNYGFTLYRINTHKFKHLKITGGVSDRGVVLIDDKEVAVLWTDKDYLLTATDSEFSNKTEHILDILVENTGRVNVGGGMNTARKGLNGNVLVDEKTTSKYTIFPMEFKQQYMEQLKQLKGRALSKPLTGPSLFRAELDIKGQPRDTFLRLDNWKKGNVFVNGFNVGRYYDIGPQHTLYIPAPLLKTGINDIFVFELHSAAETVHFVDKPDLGK